MLMYASVAFWWEWFVTENVKTIQDRYAVSRSMPSIDVSQDWFLTSGQEENGRTILEFNRKFTSCDVVNDLDITVCLTIELSLLFLLLAFLYSFLHYIVLF